MRLRSRLVAAIGVFVLAVVSAAGTANAASVHLKGGANAEPTFTDGGLFLSAAGDLAGLGNGDVIVSLSATGNPDSRCQNPGTNLFEAPGQNPAPITVTGTQVIPEEEIKNGNTPFNVATTSPVTPVPGAPDCPNSNWTEVILDMAFTSATITVEQPAGNLVLTVTCTIDPPSSDGVISKADVTCISS